MHPSNRLPPAPPVLQGLRSEHSEGARLRCSAPALERKRSASTSAKL
ncbi:hypothetical protein CSUI_000957, partial [Cystoisospora suis]